MAEVSTTGQTIPAFVLVPKTVALTHVNASSLVVVVDGLNVPAEQLVHVVDPALAYVLPTAAALEYCMKRSWHKRWRTCQLTC
jgi:hypothetical protein